MSNKKYRVVVPRTLKAEITEIATLIEKDENYIEEHFAHQLISGGN